MFEHLPSLRGFQPHFYHGGPSRFYLPLLYDLVAAVRPRSTVILGWDAEVHFTLCQAVREHAIDGKVTCIRDAGDGAASDDQEWQAGIAHADEFYHSVSRLIEPAADRDGDFTDLFVVHDFSALGSVRNEFAVAKPAGVVLVYGIDVQRRKGPRELWNEIRSDPAAELRLGNGVGLTSSAPAGDVPLLKKILENDSTRAHLTELYALATERIDATARAEKTERENRLLQLRQTWQPTLLDDRLRTQETIDHLNRHIEHLARVQEWETGQAQHRERVLEHQLATLQYENAERLRQWQSDQGPLGQASGKSLPQKVLREIGRIPRNLRKLVRPAATKHAPLSITTAEKPSPLAPVTATADARYLKWIGEHEPPPNTPVIATAEAPIISLLVPVHNTPAKFLDEMIASVARQTDPHWQLCIVGAPFADGASQEVLDRWRAAEPRIRFEAAAQNPGIANNTNRALRLADGEFIALLDHDDLLAPFAIHELRTAIHAFPSADVFYSDEDRWNESGQRHSPFFKPEWSPELLFSCMYLGHLCAYRRALAEELGGFREEFDLSQDYDFALRATETAREIRHIPHVLYHWREHPASGSAGGKPEARTSNLASLRAAAERRRLAADVIAYPAANRVRMGSERTARVSIIVPSDSPERTLACAIDLPRATSYPDFEVVIVTNSDLVRALNANDDRAANVRNVQYDEAFNFSAKCNAGARGATGEILIFFNDDVSPLQPDWIENLIEPLEIPEIGAVAPKMVYADGRIQHAGLVTGVRGLIGTAFHLLPHDSAEHVNFAQSMRDVSALSGACLAVNREQFFQLGGFDSENVPVLHSDVDFCFKMRDAKLRCVYTPFVSMRHLGHASLAVNGFRGRTETDKSDIYLLKRWGGYVARDPYFPPNMRDWLYRDSPEPLEIFGANCAIPSTSTRDVLYVCADLAQSETTSSFLQRAIEAKRRGEFVVIATAAGGSLGERCLEAGVVLIVDPLILRGDETSAELCRGFDLIVFDPRGGKELADALTRQRVPVEMIAGAVV